MSDSVWMERSMTSSANRKEFAEAPRSCPCAAVMPHRNKGQPFVLARNLASITCSVTQSELLRFDEAYGIPMCYDPQLPSSEQTALDAPKVFKFFRCHFPLMNPFGVPRVTTFAIACKAYGEGEPSLPLFRSLYNVGPVDSLVLDACPALITDFCHGLGTFAFPTLKNRLVRLYVIALRAILLKPRLFRKLFCTLLVLPVPGKMSFRNFMKRPSQTPTFSTRHAEESIDDVAGSELVIIEDIPFGKRMVAAKASGEKRSITTDLEEGTIVVRRSAIGRSSKHEGKKRKQEGPRQTSLRGSLEPTSNPFVLDVQEAHAAYNLLSRLICPSLRRQLDDFSFDDLVNVYDVYILHVVIVGNMLANESR
nr:hypothetical protein [Tanacetum cinerariifolium]